MEASSSRGSHPPNQDELCNEKFNLIINVVDISSDDELIKSVNSRIAKRLRTRKGKVVADTNSPKPNRTRVVVGPLKYWSKVNVSSKKRKIRTETEFEDDVGDVQDITRVKKTVTKQSSVKVPNTPMDNISFHSFDNVGTWRFVYQRRISLERELVGFAKCYEVMVKEFVVNISVDSADPGSQNFRKIYVRGKCVHFSPAVINRYLGRSEDEGCDLEVTDNQHKIGAANWVSTNHTSIVAVGLGKFLYIVGTKTSFDYGTYTFYQTVRHAATNVTKMPIVFPSLICGVVLNQHPGILLSTNVVCKRESALSLHEKLFTGKHVADIVLASAEKKPSTKADVDLALKETCEDLDEIIATSTKWKLDIEQLIKSLEQSNGNRIGDSTEEEPAEAHRSVEGTTP
ncbi:uncharacterized protein LOC131629691 [Vicia villosa]|uniref:uncharacterized protein LOC131629691 n=1 Tax=Vicia villosa TaxID=3911 RepID=UPI00273C1A42|nr:uncharacterized protein LOC131629691 [Vicia villosa]